MSAFGTLHRSAFLLLPAAIAALAMTACGADSTGGAPVGINGDGTPTLGGVCNPSTATNACVGQNVLACTPAGTWIVHQTCSIGEKCQQSATMATCVAASVDAGGGGSDDAGIGSDAESGFDATVDDSTVGTDASGGSDGTVQPGLCTTYQDVQTIFVNNCNGCHGHQFGNGCSSAANYPLIAQYVGSGAMPPGGGLGASDKALIAAWAAGHNTCTPDKCPGADAGPTDIGAPDAGPGIDVPVLDDSITVADTIIGPPDVGPPPTCTNYQDVQAIFQNNCNGCHGHTFGNGCTSASNYASINAYVQSGSMPQGGSLSSADKATIAAWAAGKNVCSPGQCPGGAPDAGPTDTGPGPDTVGPGPDTIGPGPDTVGPGPDTVGPGPDTITPPPATCGNLKCDTGETAANCPIDCGSENTCILTNCQQQANACTNSNSCRTGFQCEQACAAGDAACINKCLAGKSNKTKNNLNNLNTCIANNNCISGGGVTPPAGNVCDNACGAQGGTVGGKPCYCDTQCATYGDCCNAAGTATGTTCAGSTCTQCNGGGTTPTTCGNGTCDAGETTANCPADCPPPAPVCGNGTCEAPTETTANCPADCPAKTCTTYTDVQAIFQNNCNGCHGHTFGNGCSSASNYSLINSYVQSGSMPQGSSLSAADKAKIAAWAAAKNACTLAACP